MKNHEIYELNDLITAVKKNVRLKYLFFWGHRPQQNGIIGKECFSQWWPCSFEIDGIVYSTAEHFMMAEKARLFNDQDIREKIISSSHPGAAKNLGREIVNFDEDVWCENRFDIVVKGNLAKFSQNNELKSFLINTKDRILVEASPIDKIWGVGLAKDHNDIENPLKWEGLNLLGFALMKTRSLLANEL